MKHRLFLTFLLLLNCVSSSFAQSYFDSLTTTKVIACKDVSVGSSFYFTRFVETQQYDSARQLLDYWQSRCGISEPVFRGKVIMRMLADEPVEDLLTNDVFWHFNSYSSHVNFQNNNYYNGYNNYSYTNPFVAREYDSFSVHFFKNELSSHEVGTSEYLLCEFYANGSDSFYATIQRSKCDSSFICKEYNKEVSRYLNMVEGNYALLTGLWLPTGGIKHLGAHPMIGVQFGGKYKRLNIDLTFSFKFLKSQTPYLATRVNSNDSTEVTDKFFGGYFGLDFGYDLYRKRRNVLQLLCGIGYDGFDVLDVIDEDKSTELKAESVSSYNFNFGIGYRRYINNWTYVGLLAKYNIVDYTSNGVVNFTGNPVTITFIVGGLSNQRKKYGLESLGYYNIRK